MKVLLKILAWLLGILVVLIIILPFVIPTDAIFDQVSQQVETTTGRKLTIAGDKSLSVFPALKLELNDVKFANMKSGSRPEMVSMKQLAVHIPWLSLLSGEFKLDKFIIIEPDILLEKNSQGEMNWQLLEQVTKKPAETKGTSEVGGLPEGFDIQLGEVGIQGGRLTYIDEATKTSKQIKNLDLLIKLPSLKQALKIAGSVEYMNEVFKLDVALNTPEKVITGDDFLLNLMLDSRFVALKYQGEIQKDGKEIKGSLTVAGNSVKEITQWQGITLDSKANAFNQFSFNGDMHFSEQKLTLTKLVAKLDKLDIKGQSTLNLADRLNIKADFDLGMLDLNPYLPEPVKQEITPEEAGQAQPIVWDDTKIDLSAIDALDAVIKIRSSGLKVRDIELGENAFSFKLKQGIATIKMERFNAYEGKGIGKIMINAKANPYVIETNFDLAGIQAEPLLIAAAGVDKLSGKGAINWELTTKGLSQKEFVSHLSGKLGFNFLDGAIKGANLAALVRSAQAMLKGDFSKAGLETEYDKAKKTDFAELTGTFDFTKGISETNNLKLLSPLIRVTGNGAINLPSTNLDYGLITALVATIEGQGSDNKSTGFKVPIRIKGPFHKVDIKLDISGSKKQELKDKAKDKLKSKFKKLFG